LCDAETRQHKGHKGHGTASVWHRSVQHQRCTVSMYSTVRGASRRSYLWQSRRAAALMAVAADKCVYFVMGTWWGFMDIHPHQLSTTVLYGAVRCRTGLYCQAAHRSPLTRPIISPGTAGDLTQVGNPCSLRSQREARARARAPSRETTELLAVLERGIWPLPFRSLFLSLYSPPMLYAVQRRRKALKSEFRAPFRSSGLECDVVTPAAGRWPGVSIYLHSPITTQQRLLFLFCSSP
jgi:hypothetical protein